MRAWARDCRDLRGRAAPERFAASQYGVITRAEAGLCGLTPRMVEHRIRPGGPWQRLLPGVYLTQAGEPGRDQLLMAALRYAGDESMVTGLAALRRHEISVPATQAVDVLVPHARRRSSRGFVVVHRTIRVPADVLGGRPHKVRATGPGGRRRRTSPEPV